MRTLLPYVSAGLIALSAPTPLSAQSCTMPADPTPVAGIRSVSYMGAAFPAKVVSLTYDDGPTHMTLPIAQYLNDEGIRATFFVVTGLHGVGPAAGPCVETVARPLGALPVLKQLGHRVANHTYNHQSLNYAAVTPAGVRYQVCRVQQDIDDPNISDGIAFLRGPGGCWDDIAYCCPYKFAGVCQSGDCQCPSVALQADPAFNRITGPIHWSLSINEGIEGGYTSDEHCFRNGHSPTVCGGNLLAQLDTGPIRQGIVLLHDFLWTETECPIAPPPPGTKSWALQLSEYLVPQLKQRHYLILPLDADPELPGGMLMQNASLWSSGYSDAEGWHSHIGYYGTFRMGDVNGDGKSDVCARGYAGVYCSLSTGAGFAPYAVWQAELSNINGWSPEQYSRTLQLGDINGDGKADICGIGYAAKVWCALSNGASSFGAISSWLDAPSAVVTDPAYFATVRLGDVTGDGRADLCFRLNDGIHCAPSTGTAFQASQRWTTEFAGTWDPAQYSSTLQLADLDGDGRADICGRGFSGLYCGFSNGTAFHSVAMRSAGANFANFSDYDGFAGVSPGFAPDYYGTLRFADVTGDGRADACIRSAAGILCAAWNPGQNRFDTYRVWQKADFRDDVNRTWNPAPYALTFMLGDATGDGKADICARSSTGIRCAPVR